MTKEELLVSLQGDVQAQIPLRLDSEFGELVLTNATVVFIVSQRNGWIIKREWKKIALHAWSIRNGILGRKLILYFRAEIVLFHHPPRQMNFWTIFVDVEPRLSSLDDGYWAYYWRRFLGLFT